MVGTQLSKIDRPTELDSITVEYGERGRVVKCFCGENISRSIVPHLKKEHPAEWREWTGTFVKLRALGYPLKRIMKLFRAGDGRLLFSWTVIERAIRYQVEAGVLSYHPPPKKTVERWNPDNFNPETTTMWDFPRRGDWAVHSGDYRGNWPPQVPRNLIERYTRRGDLVIDAFVGGGTTLIEAWLLERPSVGIDISKLAIQTTNAKLKEMKDLAKKHSSISLDPDCCPRVIEGNALQLSAVLRMHKIDTGKAKLICVHPPYLDSLKYTIDDSNDLSLLTNPLVFCQRMRLFAHEVRQVLSTDGTCAVLIGDVRKRGKTVPLGFRVLEAFLRERFELASIIVKAQHKDRSSEFYVGRTGGILLLAHEYLFILRRK